jgi:hypothetical protein
MDTAYIIVDADGTIRYQVTPQTLMAYGGSPLARYTWGKPAGGRFPPSGTIVDQLGVFKGTGGALTEFLSRYPMLYSSNHWVWVRFR